MEDTIAIGDFLYFFKKRNSFIISDFHYFKKNKL